MDTSNSLVKGSDHSITLWKKAQLSLVPSAVFAFLLVLGLGVIVIQQDSFEKGILSNSSLFQRTTSSVKGVSTVKETIAQVMERFRSIYQVTIDELPTVTEVTDTEKLKAQDPEFYQDAVVGDYVIVMPIRRVAIIYRYSENKIIYIAPVTMSDEE